MKSSWAVRWPVAVTTPVSWLTERALERRIYWMKLMLYWTLIGLQIKRIKPAERRLPSPNVTNWPDWTDATRSFRVRSQSGTSPGVFNEEWACRKNRFLTASLTVSDDERRAGELAVLHLLLYDVLLQGSCLSELRRLQRSSAPRL